MILLEVTEYRKILNWLAGNLSFTFVVREVTSFLGGLMFSQL